mgnify:FL=1
MLICGYTLGMQWRRSKTISSSTFYQSKENEENHKNVKKNIVSILYHFVAQIFLSLKHRTYFVWEILWKYIRKEDFFASFGKIEKYLITHIKWYFIYYIVREKREPSNLYKLPSFDFLVSENSQHTCQYKEYCVPLVHSISWYIFRSHRT